MIKMLIGALGLLAIGAAAGAYGLHAGLIDVAADTPHSPALTRLIAFAREQSIDRRIRDISPPADLGAAERVRRGAGNYDAMCVGCHLSPGVENSEIRAGLYPAPPDLARSGGPETSADRAPARRFWIIKHGIKASGMPAWSKGGMEDEDIWDLVAFVGRLPSLSPEEYRQQVASSGGHSHAGRPEADYPPAKPHRHDHSHHAHAH